MSIKRIVDTGFWTDDKVVDDFSPEDKLFMLYILTNPHTTQLGIYKINERQMAFELGWSKESVSVLLDRFENKYHTIKYSKDTKEIAIKNFLKHSIVKGGQPVLDLLRKEVGEVKDRQLLQFVFSHLKDYKNLNKTVSAIINENDNDNDNDNDVSYHDSYNDSYHDSSENGKINKKTPTRHKYGEYLNVLLADEQLDKLKSEFSDWEKRIERLDEYIQSSGKKYKDHLATIRNWAKKDKAEKKDTPTETKYDYNSIEEKMRKKLWGE